MRSKDQLIHGNEHKRLMRGCAEKSMDKTFGPESSTRRYPFCMRNKNPAKACKWCWTQREKLTELIKGLCRKCDTLKRKYKDKDLAKLARARIKLAEEIHVRP